MTDIEIAQASRGLGMTNHLDEQVLCIPSSRLDRMGRFQGFSKDFRLLHKLFNAKEDEFSYLPRSAVEDDPSFKQIITYSIVQYGTRRSDTLFFSYIRGKSGGEAKLHAKRSLGIGGHVSNTPSKYVVRDFPGFKGSQWMALLKTEANREINEEIIHKSPNPTFYIAGMINDDSNPVGQVHLGLVYVMICNSPDIEARELSISDGRMVTFDQLKDNKESYENWSQIVIDSIYSISRNYS